MGCERNVGLSPQASLKNPKSAYGRSSRTQQHHKKNVNLFSEIFFLLSVLLKLATASNEKNKKCSL
jgi:hypothetical protein